MAEEEGMATHEHSDLTALDFENIAREKKGLPPRVLPQKEKLLEVEDE